MIVNSHVRVGDIPLRSVSMDRDSRVAGRPRCGDSTGHTGRGNLAAIDVTDLSCNVYLETSGMPTRARSHEAVERVGPDRVISGSDTPFHHPSVELAKVRVSELPTDLTDRVLGDNCAARFFDDDTANVVT